MAQTGADQPRQAKLKPVEAIPRPISSRRQHPIKKHCECSAGHTVSGMDKGQGKQLSHYISKSYNVCMKRVKVFVR